MCDILYETISTNKFCPENKKKKKTSEEEEITTQLNVQKKKITTQLARI